MDPERLALDSRLGREVRKPLELGDKFGTAVGIARIIERVDSDIDVAGPARFGEAEREAQEDRVARRDIGHRDALAEAVFRHFDVAGQRRTAERAQVERQNDMPVGELGRDSARGIDLDPVPLAIVDGEGDDRKPASRARAAQTIESSPPDRELPRSLRRPSRLAAQARRAAGPEAGGPVDRANEPDWEESVLNPHTTPLADAG